ncbi:hypothetical protein [Mammaliicoccus sciuri]|uniref:hypothetical protein n=1 Tax=Mammaliicoccus sciuri TaxID=1296 RepID=UPI003F562EC0
MKKTKITLSAEQISNIRYLMWKDNVDRRTDYLDNELKKIIDGEYDDLKVGLRKDSQTINVDKELADAAREKAKKLGYSNLTHMVGTVLEFKRQNGGAKDGKES